MRFGRLLRLSGPRASARPEKEPARQALRTTNSRRRARTSPEHHADPRRRSLDARIGNHADLTTTAHPSGRDFHSQTKGARDVHQAFAEMARGLQRAGGHCPSGSDPAMLERAAMSPVMKGLHAATRDDLLVHNWRVSQLERLGVPSPLSTVYADRVDWHEVARLVQRGCPPQLALRIAG